MIKNFVVGFLGILFQDLPYIVNRVFRHIDFRLNRIRILDQASDIELKHLAVQLLERFRK